MEKNRLKQPHEDVEEVERGEREINALLSALSLGFPVQPHKLPVRRIH